MGLNENCQLERLGGLVGLRKLMEEFVGRVVEDTMIGFFFRNVDQENLIEREFQFAANFWGAEVEYGGRPLKEAHGKHRIMGGQFARRKQILREVLTESGIDDDLIEIWMDHTEKLRPLITKQPGGECLHESEERSEPKDYSLKIIK